MRAILGPGPDQEEVASLVPVEAVEENLEELVSGAEARTALVTGGDLELLAEEQVLEEEALATAQGVDERGQEEPEEFDHRGRIADRSHLAGRGAEPSSRREFHPPALTEPDVSLATHPARAIQPTASFRNASARTGWEIPRLPAGGTRKPEHGFRTTVCTCVVPTELDVR